MSGVVWASGSGDVLALTELGLPHVVLAPAAVANDDAEGGGKDSCEKILHEVNSGDWWHIHSKKQGSLALSLGMQWWLPVGDFYDRWNDGFGFNMHFDFWMFDTLTIGFAFSDIGLRPNSNGLKVDTAGWDANIYNWSFSPKIYILENRFFLNPALGWYGVRTSLPNYDSLSPALQDVLGSKNRLGGSVEIGVLVWNFIIFGGGYHYIPDEGQAAMIDLSFHL
jgi:hypothetical protein